MFPELDLLRQWGIPFTQRGGVTLVDRRDAAACVTHILRDGCRFHGYDAFAVTASAIQPYLEFSPDWSRGGTPSLDTVLSQLQDHPPQITHYEFVFDEA
jgi:hypothetical protein